MNKLDLFSSKGRLLIQVAKKPGTTILELAENLFVTKRTVYGMVGELRSIGYLVVKKGRPDGRAHHYYVSSCGLAELRKLTEQVDKRVGFGSSS